MTFPGPVVFNDDDPKKGYTTLFLKVPDLSISKPVFGKGKPKNADIKFSECTNTVVSLEIHVKDKKGNITGTYVYTKKLPEDIDPDKTIWEVNASHASRVILHLCKAKPASWAEHRQYFIDDS